MPEHPAGAVSPADELRVRIRQHLRAFPEGTVHGIARVLGAGESAVRRRLEAMEADGEARGVTEKRRGDPGPVTRWTAT